MAIALCAAVGAAAASTPRLALAQAADEAPLDVDALIDRQAAEPEAPDDPIRIERALGRSRSAVSDMIEVIDETDYFRDSYEAAERALRSGQAEAALGIYDDLLRRQPTDRVALVGRASALHRMMRVGDAIRAYETVLRQYPDEMSALTNLLALIGRQTPERALNELRRLYTVSPGHASVAAQIAMLQAQLGDVGGAIRYMKEAAALEPHNPVYHVNLAILHDRAGETAAAIESYQRALDLAALSSRPLPLGIGAIEQRLRYLRRNLTSVQPEPVPRAASEPAPPPAAAPPPAPPTATAPPAAAEPASAEPTTAQPAAAAPPPPAAPTPENAAPAGGALNVLGSWFGLSFGADDDGETVEVEAREAPPSAAVDGEEAGSFWDFLSIPFGAARDRAASEDPDRPAAPSDDGAGYDLLGISIIPPSDVSNDATMR